MTVLLHVVSSALVLGKGISHLKCQPEFQQNFAGYPEGTSFSAGLSVHSCGCTRESQGQNERQRELVSLCQDISGHCWFFLSCPFH